MALHPRLVAHLADGVADRAQLLQPGAIPAPKSLTNEPVPWRMSTRPCASSVRSAVRTVTRETS
ncbi:hypothetical protein BJF90_32910 [Pseudonocardia sp. CNS-004]|nr:hypothetical protein BJF90_32910 [Pseudonocardia sp. CNS-004]